MKKVFIAFASLCSSWAFAQFNIEGKLENYQNQPLIAKVYNGVLPTVVNKVNTNADGRFTIKIPQKYTGVIDLVLNNDETIQLMSDNKDVVFTGKNEKPVLSSIQVTKGELAKQFVSASQNSLFVDLKSTVLEQLINYYQPKDEFYAAIQKEMNRIDAVSSSTAKAHSLLQSHSHLQTLIKSALSEYNPSDLDKILFELKNEKQPLEQTGLMNTLIFNYVSAEFTEAQKQGKGVEETIQPILQKLMGAVDLNTQRGQNVLAVILNLLSPQQFPNLNKEYVNLAHTIKGEKSQDLKISLLNIEGLKVGETVPNFKFEQAINGKQSLFDVKADKKLIVFWASWCPACMNEMPLIEEYYKKFKSEGGEIVAVSLDYNQNDFDNATKNFPWYNTTELLRWDSEIAKQYGVNSTPTIFLVDKDNKLIKKVNHISNL